ncbi:HAD superfamily hydrolase (TIGR01549 family) [Symbiobacterium terraclitae]|uniref:HAD superfamily hydrolase (TIGR01549 family) n=1 Tax=Symbiobacterium terraclitae TaxID=557451 RepID=A0ABS4JX26_9FIRM|nr:HAD superfamily hydrolase (TIGR01549 family) [Symbiobacterium terraclitae]
MYKCVAFDVDGTLIDTNQSIIASLQQVLLEELGRKYSEDELRFALGIPGAVVLEQLGVPDVQAAIHKWIAYSRESSHLVSAFPGIEDLLAGLRAAGITLGIVTSRTRGELDILSRFGFRDSFAAVVCADDTERGKPSADPLLKLLADTGLGPADVLYVGDSVNDSLCAHAAGVKFALALWGAVNPAVPCDYRPAHPSELLTLCQAAR